MLSKHTRVKLVRHGNSTAPRSTPPTHKRWMAVPLGAEGEVIAVRVDNEGPVYLVKFVGVGTPRHCTTPMVESLREGK